jgi:AcrR family transcriptional regulator
MSPKRTSHIRRPEIVNAALRIIGQGGVRSLTVAAIAREAGMTEMNLYRHFHGKDEILLAVGERVGEEIMDRAAAIAGGKKEPLAKLKAIYDSHIAAVSATPGIPRFVLSEEIHIGHPELARLMAERLGGYVEILSGIISDGIAEGRFPKGLSPPHTAMTLLGMIQFAVTRRFVGNMPMGTRKEANDLWRNFRSLLAAGGNR